MIITLTWTPSGATQPAKFVVCDSPGATGLKSYVINGDQKFQEAEFFRAAQRAFYARGNEKTTVTIEVSRQWPDQVTAESYVNFYNTKFPRLAAVEFKSFAGGKSQSAYFKSAAIHPAASRLAGCTTYHQHRIEGGIMSASPN